MRGGVYRGDLDGVGGRGRGARSCHHPGMETVRSAAAFGGGGGSAGPGRPRGRPRPHGLARHHEPTPDPYASAPSGRRGRRSRARSASSSSRRPPTRDPRSRRRRSGGGTRRRAARSEVAFASIRDTLGGRSVGPGWVLFARGVCLRNAKGELVSDARGDDPINLACTDATIWILSVDPVTAEPLVGAHGVRRDRARSAPEVAGPAGSPTAEEALPADPPSGVGLRAERPQEPALGEVVGARIACRSDGATAGGSSPTGGW